MSLQQSEGLELNRLRNNKAPVNGKSIVIIPNYFHAKRFKLSIKKSVGPNARTRRGNYGIVKIINENNVTILIYTVVYSG